MPYVPASWLPGMATSHSCFPRKWHSSCPIHWRRSTVAGPSRELCGSATPTRSCRCWTHACCLAGHPQSMSQVRAPSAFPCTSPATLHRCLMRNLLDCEAASMTAPSSGMQSLTGMGRFPMSSSSSSPPLRLHTTSRSSGYLSLPYAPETSTVTSPSRSFTWNLASSWHPLFSKRVSINVCDLSDTRWPMAFNLSCTIVTQPPNQ
mmetsp:Transcript_50467/g.84411  ORF Transcript_50467/g.84411 Transcript_50467/m.84411 type:complete len:205 (-) Transcript_50467:65-679(-)